MTAMDNSETTEATATVEPDGTPVTNADLNRYAKDQKARADAAHRELLEMRFENLGLDPTKGLGKAVIGGYEGDTSKEAVAKYLKDEYEYTPPEPQTNDPTAAEQNQAKVEGMESMSQPIPPVDTTNPLVQAEQKLVDPEATRQDAMNSTALKVEAYLKSLPNAP